MNNEELKVTAFHEAGHVVIGVANGFDLDCVLLQPVDVGQDYVGVATTRWHYEDGPFVHSEKEFPAILAMAAGGAAGEMIGLKLNQVHETDPEGMVMDIANIRSQQMERKEYLDDKHTLGIFLEAIDAAYKKLKVSPYYGQIHAVADLIQRAVLSGDERIEADRIRAVIA